jgi:hypothetical protein
MQPKAPRARVLLLQVQHLFEKRECQLVIGMGRGAGPVVLKAFKPIPFKGRNKEYVRDVCNFSLLG